MVVQLSLELEQQWRGWGVWGEGASGAPGRHFYSCINNKAQRSPGASPYQMFTLMLIPVQAVFFVCGPCDSALNRYIKSTSRRRLFNANPEEEKRRRICADQEASAGGGPRGRLRPRSRKLSLPRRLRPLRRRRINHLHRRHFLNEPLSGKESNLP